MMQGWAASPPSRAQSYSVACSEGHRLHGQRTEGYQALRCPTCGEGIFVLPRSPLPEPSAPATPARSRVAAAVEAYPEDDPHLLTDPLPSMVTVDEIDEPEAEIDWVDEVPTEPETPKEDAPERPIVPSPVSKVVRPATGPAKPQPGRSKVLEPKIAVAVQPTLREWALAHRNALLVAAVLLLVVGAVTIRFRRQRLEELPQIAELGRTEGLKKLDAGEFFVAKKLLSDATDAVNGLGGRYEGADEIRQGALEASIFADRAPEGIAEIVEEAANSDPKLWPSKFASLYRGRSVIIEAPISAVPDPNRQGSSYQINYPIYFGRGPKPTGKGRIDLAGFKLFELAQPKLDEPKLFGARYASVELDLTSNEWVVTFEPDSGVFITHTKALGTIDWPTFEPNEEPGP
jgi:DNA-directed RNA polymerase subunit RPC12/RpoP